MDAAKRKENFKDYIRCGEERIRVIEQHIYEEKGWPEKAIASFKLEVIDMKRMGINYLILHPVAAGYSAEFGRIRGDSDRIQGHCGGFAELSI